MKKTKYQLFKGMCKAKAHFHFDKLLKQNFLRRKIAYKQMALMLDVPIKKSHIRYLKPKQCNQVIKYSKQLLTEIHNINNHLNYLMDAPYN